MNTRSSAIRGFGDDFIVRESGTIPDPAASPMPAPPPAVDSTLAERGKRYGTFQGHAQVTQELKQTIAEGLRSRGKVLAYDQQEALDMICHKIGRIVNGDPNYADSWHDIVGYAALVDKRLQGEVI